MEKFYAESISCEKFSIEISNFNVMLGKNELKEKIWSQVEDDMKINEITKNVKVIDV